MWSIVKNFKSLNKKKEKIISSVDVKRGECHVLQTWKIILSIKCRMFTSNINVFAIARFCIWITSLIVLLLLPCFRNWTNKKNAYFFKKFSILFLLQKAKTLSHTFSIDFILKNYSPREKKMNKLQQFVLFV